ncbi:hypothetical protein CHPG_00019 [Cellulophaga phage phi3:1]|nr:hypothetical protein CHPG_00019 [Cellulophaga phage phi3:1]
MMKTILLLAFSLCSFFAVAQTQDVTIAVPTPDQIIDTINNRPEGKKISASAIEGTFEDSVLSAEAQASLARANESITSELTNDRFTIASVVKAEQTANVVFGFEHSTNSTGENILKSSLTSKKILLLLIMVFLMSYLLSS